MPISFYLIIFLLYISFQACHPKDLHFHHNKLQVPIQDELAKMAFYEDKLTAECMKQARVKQNFKSEGLKYKMMQLKRLKDELKVSWHLPDRKRVKDKNAGFNSDYEHARTHPPSHN